MSKCTCKRSPTGMCNGWHRLTNEEYEVRKAKYEQKQKDKHQQHKPKLRRYRYVLVVMVLFLHFHLYLLSTFHIVLFRSILLILDWRIL